MIQIKTIFTCINKNKLIIKKIIYLKNIYIYVIIYHFFLIKTILIVCMANFSNIDGYKNSFNFAKISHKVIFVEYSEGKSGKLVT